MQKVSGVASVRVSLNEGLTVVDLKPGNNVTLVRLREVIRNNGFTTKEARIVASGAALPSGNDVAFEIGGTHERLSVRANTADLLTKAKATQSANVVVTGSVDISDPKSMKLTIVSVAQP